MTIPAFGNAGDPSTIRIVPEDWLNPLPLETWFDPARPLHVDLGCGKGRFLLARAAQTPEINYLGIDRMLRRIRKIDRKAMRMSLFNIRLLRIEAYYAVLYLVPRHAVDVYYIFFPDPWPKARHVDHRLFNRDFLHALHATMKPDAQVHVATDHLPYFETIINILSNDPRFTRTETYEPAPEEKTDFELLFLAEHRPIGRASFIAEASMTPPNRLC